MTISQEKSKELFQLVVQEFRAWQALISLMHGERSLLMDCDLPGLVSLAHQKNELLAHLSECRQLRCQVVPEELCASVFGSTTLENESVFDRLPAAEAVRLARMMDGIQILAWQVGELAQGNHALADCSTRRLWSIQSSIYLWAQGDSQTKLPALLTALLADQKFSEKIEDGSLISEFAAENL